MTKTPTGFMVTITNFWFGLETPCCHQPFSLQSVFLEAVAQFSHTITPSSVLSKQMSLQQNFARAVRHFNVCDDFPSWMHGVIFSGVGGHLEQEMSNTPIAQSLQSPVTKLESTLHLFLMQCASKEVNAILSSCRFCIFHSCFCMKAWQAVVFPVEYLSCTLCNVPCDVQKLKCWSITGEFFDSWNIWKRGNSGPQQQIWC